MLIDVDSELEAALNDLASRQGVAPEALVLDALRVRFLPRARPVEPQDDWERNLFGAAINCGVSVPDSALRSDGLYD